jgi:hypothetical protein
MPNGEGTQPLKGFQNSNLNFKLTIATFQIYFGNSPTTSLSSQLILIIEEHLPKIFLLSFCL